MGSNKTASYNKAYFHPEPIFSKIVLVCIIKDLSFLGVTSTYDSEPHRGVYFIQPVWNNLKTCLKDAFPLYEQL